MDIEKDIEPQSFKKSIEKFEVAKENADKADLSFDEEKKMQIEDMKAKYGRFICPYCKCYLAKKQTCAWRYSTIMMKRVAKALQERVMVGAKPQFCELFEKKQINEADIKKEKVHWKERVMGGGLVGNPRTGRVATQ